VFRVGSVVVFMLAALAGWPVLGADGIISIPDAQAQRVVYQLARTVQTANGPQSTTETFDLVRRNPTTVVLERQVPGTPLDQTVLKIGSDGSLTFADPAHVAKDLGETLHALNIAVAATRSGLASSATWDALIPVASAAGSPIASMQFAESNAVGRAFDFSGTGQVAAGPPGQRRVAANDSGNAPAGGSGLRGGGFPGGGFPGGAGGPGGFPGGRGLSEPNNRNQLAGGAGGNSAKMATMIHVDGHVVDQHLSRIAITVTRSVMIGNEPFVNVSVWQMTIAN